MKRLFILAAISMLAFSGCVKNSKTETTPSKSIEDVANSIAKGEQNVKKDMSKFGELNRKIALRLFSKGVSKQAWIEAIKSGDDSKLRAASGVSDAEYASMVKAIENARTAIFKKYPEALRSLEQSRKCTSCDAEKLIAVINKIPIEVVNGMEMIFAPALTNSIMPNARQEEIEGEGFGCRQPHITVCLVACGFAGPWGYPPCAYLCTLEYC